MATPRFEEQELALLLTRQVGTSTHLLQLGASCEYYCLEAAKVQSQGPNSPNPFITLRQESVAKASGTATEHRIGSSRLTRGLTGMAPGRFGRAAARMLGASQLPAEPCDEFELVAQLHN